MRKLLLAVGLLAITVCTGCMNRNKTLTFEDGMVFTYVDAIGGTVGNDRSESYVITLQNGTYTLTYTYRWEGHEDRVETYETSIETVEKLLAITTKYQMSKWKDMRGEPPMDGAVYYIEYQDGAGNIPLATTNHVPKKYLDDFQDIFYEIEMVMEEARQ